MRGAGAREHLWGKTIMKHLIVALAFACAAPALAADLSLDSVVALNAAGLGDDAIIAKIKGSGTVFDLSPDQMIALKHKGVSGRVIAALVSSSSGGTTMSADSPNPMVPHMTGVYLLDDTLHPAKMVRIDATVSNQAKTGGIIGYALTGGIASLSVKAVVQNDTARVHASTSTPVFYFFFDEANANGGAVAGTFASGTAATVSTPSEFSLIGLLKKQGRREARVGSANIGGVKSGVLDKDRLDFTYSTVRPGVYKVVPSRTLAPGEYGFIYAVNGQATGGAVSARIFDFAVN